MCVVFSYHQKFNLAEIPEIRQGCESGALGCVDCKKNCSSKIAESLAPFREKRAYFESNPVEVKFVLSDGESRAKRIAEETMREVRDVMKIG